MGETYYQKRYTVLGWFFSLLLHSALAVILLMIFVDMTPKTPEFVEVTLSSYIATGRPEISERRLQPSTIPAQQASIQDQPKRVVDLPKRKMINRDLDRIPVDTKERIPANESIRNISERIDPLRGVTKESQITRENQQAGNRLPPGSQRIAMGEKVTNPIASDGIEGNLKMEKPYDISWEGGAREILADPLPVFPDNIFKEVTLKFRIEVLPNGTVNEVLLLQKGEATLENITKQALKKWLFNPLEKSAPQITQNGSVIFRFIVK